MSENLINSIEQLLRLGKGDRGRLEYILDLLQKGRNLPFSDQKYLENIISLHLEAKSESLPQNKYSNEELYNEMQSLNQKIPKVERKGFEKYIGKKAVIFFVTCFVGWNVLQSYAITILSPFASYDVTQYLFPLNVLANYFNAGSYVWFVFILILLAWPFIGAIHLANFIRTRKISNVL